MDKVAEMTKDEVKRKLDKGRFLSSKPKKEYDPNLRSEVYNVINVIYDTKLKQRLKMWYQCNECSKILKAKAKTGNGSLRYHPCFEEWKKKNQPQTTTYDSSDDEEVKSVTDDMNVIEPGGSSLSDKSSDKRTTRAQSDKAKQFIELGRELGIEISSEAFTATSTKPGRFVRAPLSSSDE